MCIRDSRSETICSFLLLVDVICTTTIWARIPSSLSQHPHATSQGCSVLNRRSSSLPSRVAPQRPPVSSDFLRIPASSKMVSLWRPRVIPRTSPPLPSPAGASYVVTTSASQWRRLRVGYFGRLRMVGRSKYPNPRAPIGGCLGNPSCGFSHRTRSQPDRASGPPFAGSGMSDQRA